MHNPLLNPNPLDESPLDDNNVTNEMIDSEIEKDDIDLGEPIKRNAVNEKFKSSNKRSIFDNKKPNISNEEDDKIVEDDGLVEEEIIEEESKSNNRTKRIKNNPSSQDNHNNQNHKSPLNTFFERIVFILLCMFFIWFTISVIKTSNNNVTNVADPMDSANRFLRNFSDNMSNAEENLDTLFEYEYNKEE